jgi:hypothetical protein
MLTVGQRARPASLICSLGGGWGWLDEYFPEISLALAEKKFSPQSFLVAPELSPFVVILFKGKAL